MLNNIIVQFKFLWNSRSVSTVIDNRCEIHYSFSSGLCKLVNPISKSKFSNWILNFCKKRNSSLKKLKLKVYRLNRSCSFFLNIFRKISRTETERNETQGATIKIICTQRRRDYLVAGLSAPQRVPLRPDIDYRELQFPATGDCDRSLRLSHKTRRARRLRACARFRRARLGFFSTSTWSNTRRAVIYRALLPRIVDVLRSAVKWAINLAKRCDVMLVPSTIENGSWTGSEKAYENEHERRDDVSHLTVTPALANVHRRAISVSLVTISPCVLTETVEIPDSASSSFWRFKENVGVFHSWPRVYLETRALTLLLSQKCAKRARYLPGTPWDVTILSNVGGKQVPNVFWLRNRKSDGNKIHRIREIDGSLMGNFSTR